MNYVRYSLSLEKPVSGAKLDDFKRFLEDVVLDIFSNAQGYKPANCQKIEVVGKVFFDVAKKKENKKTTTYPEPVEFSYSSRNEIMLKQIIEQQINAILSKRLPKKVNKIKIKFIIKFYY